MGVTYSSDDEENVEQGMEWEWECRALVATSILQRSKIVKFEAKFASFGSLNHSANVSPP
jgi:hypothetical protein